VTLAIVDIRTDAAFDLEQQDILRAGLAIEDAESETFAGGVLEGYCLGDETVINLCGAAWFDNGGNVAIQLEFSFEGVGFDLAKECLRRILFTASESMIKLA